MSEPVAYKRIKFIVEYEADIPETMEPAEAAEQWAAFERDVATDPEDGYWIHASHPHAGYIKIVGCQGLPDWKLEERRRVFALWERAVQQHLDALTSMPLQGCLIPQSKEPR